MVNKACITCSEKHKRSAHAKRDSTMKAQRTALTSGEEVKTLTCRGCGPKPIEEFGIGKNGKPLSRCNDCNDKHNETNNSSANNAEVKRKYAKGGLGRATNKRYLKGDAGRAANKRYLKGDAGRAMRGREYETNRMRRFFDKGFALDHAIECAATDLLSGRRETSPTFVARTSFSSAHDFRLHMKSTLPEGLVLADVYGEPEDAQEREQWDSWCDHFYQQEHRIPREAYDHSNPSDVKRCWSKQNMLLRTAKDNKDKSYTLLDTEIASVGEDHWPLAWNGVPPTEAEKLEVYQRWTTKWSPTDEQKTQYIQHLERKNAVHEKIHKRVKRALSGPREEGIGELDAEMSDHTDSDDGEEDEEEEDEEDEEEEDEEEDDEPPTE